MVEVGPAQIIAGVSLLSGLLLLVASSIFTDDARFWNDWCNKLHGDCTNFRYFLAAASFAIIASLLHFGSGVIAFMQKWKIWCLLHAIIFVLCVLAFSLAIAKDADDLPNVPKGKAYGSRAKFFLAWTALDFIFAAVGAGAVFFFTK